MIFKDFVQVLTNDLFARCQFPSFFVAVLLMLASSTAEAQVFYYHGRLMNAQGTPLNSGTVDFTVEIRSPNAAQCLLFSEKHSIDMTGSYGYFRIAVNGGSGTRQPDGGVAFSQVFSNGAAFTGLAPAAACVGGGTFYTPAPTDGRALVLKVDARDGLGAEPFAAEILQPALFAQDAAKVGGYPSTSLLRVSDTTIAPELTAQQFTDLTALIGGTSSQYIQSSTTAGATLPTLATAPTTPTAGKIWYNSTTGTLQFANASGTQTLGTGSGTITQIIAGSGLTGGTITSSGTIALASSGVTAGTYTKLVVDGFGRALSGGSLGTADLPALDGSLISSGTISAARMPAFSGDATTSAGSTVLTLATTAVSAGTYPKVTVDTKGRVTAGMSLAAGDLPSHDASLIASGTLSAARLPAIDASLISSGTLSAARLPSHDASLITSGTLGAARMPAFSGDATSSAGATALTLATTGVTAGTYPKVTVDTKGRVTAGSTLSASDLPIVTIAKGGTGSTDGSITGSGALTFAAGGSNQNITLTPSGTGFTILNGNVGIGVSSPNADLEIKGHMGFSGNTSGTTTVSSCGNGASITGNDSRGTVTMGTGNPSSCLITFGSAFGTTPTCVVIGSGSDPGGRFWVTSTTSDVTVSTSSTTTSGKSFNYICIQ